ncbi:uncharacterized protein LOC109546633 isoform X1 [Dendroctonus ponderosae]|uniref:uncharacterized protein LOC109546633 isoform X1 n=1 Tax=Dendroctonus ponderosae TaxID=77166 RepID=UPI0020359372|nr:uncharacterized protein LOC109546633 isoform X1 [Dendroctonus ponderosae]
MNFCTLCQKTSSNGSVDDLKPAASPLLEPSKQMSKPGPKIIRTINGSELNSNNIILVRSTKTLDGGHILLRTDNFVKNNVLLDDGRESKMGQIILQPNSEFKKGVYLQGVKRLGGNAPIFLLSSGDSGGHLIIQTSSEQAAAAPQRVLNADSLLKETNSTLEVASDNEAGCSSSSRTAPIGSGIG